MALGTYLNSNVQTDMPPSVSPGDANSSAPVPTTDSTTPATVSAPSPGGTPLGSIVSGVGSMLLFPGRIIVQQFAADPTDMANMPITLLLSGAAWYALYYFAIHKNAFDLFSNRSKRVSNPVKRIKRVKKVVDEGDE